MPWQKRPFQSSLRRKESSRCCCGSSNKAWIVFKEHSAKKKKAAFCASPPQQPAEEQQSSRSSHTQLSQQSLPRVGRALPPARREESQAATTPGAHLWAFPRSGSVWREGGAALEQQLLQQQGWSTL